MSVFGRLRLKKIIPSLDKEGSALAGGGLKRLKCSYTTPSFGHPTSERRGKGSILS
jgi:hypothetical protein